MRAACTNKMLSFLFIPAFLIVVMAAPDCAEARPEMAAGNMDDHFTAMDTDKDGKLSRTEFCAGLPNLRDTAFDAFDADGDGFVTLEEWTEAMSVHMGGMPPKETMTGPGPACPVSPGNQEGGSGGNKGPDLLIPPKANP